MLSVNSCTELFRPLATSSVAVPIVVAGIVELLNVIFRVPRCLAPHRTGKTSQGGEESKREEKEKKMGTTVGQHAWWVESIWHGPQLGWSPYGPRPVPSNLMKRAVPLIAQTLLWQTYTFENLDYVKRARYILQCSKRAGKDGTARLSSVGVMLPLQFTCWRRDPTDKIEEVHHWKRNKNAAIQFVCMGLGCKYPS